MKIGKTVKVVISPKRQVRKAVKKNEQAPIPVKIPEKVESFKFMGRMAWGMDIGRKDFSVINYTVTS